MSLSTLQTLANIVGGSDAQMDVFFRVLSSFLT